MRSQRHPRVVVSHPASVEECAQPRSQSFRGPAGLAALGQPAEGEDGEVVCGDDVHVVPGSPHLHERGVVQGARLDICDTRVDGQERGARHAVLKAGPRRLPKRTSPRRESLIQSADASAEREDLCSRDPQPRSRHAAQRNVVRWARGSDRRDVPGAV